MQTLASDHIARRARLGIPAPRAVVVIPSPAPLKLALHPRRFSVSEVIAAVCAVRGVQVGDLTGRKMEKQFFRPRFEAYWLARKLTARSFAALGRSFGREGTTVRQGAANHQRRLDRGFVDTLRDIQPALDGIPIIPGEIRHDEIAIPPDSELVERARFVLACTARRHGVDVAEILSDRRCKEIIPARFEAIYLVKKELPWSLPRIGRFFGNRDHQTIIHAIRSYEASLRGEVYRRPDKRKAKVEAETRP